MTHPYKDEPRGRSRANTARLSQQVASTHENATPALYFHCEAVYNRMLRDAKTQVVKEGDLNIEIVVWEGMLTTLVTSELNLSIPYYSKARNALIKMGCMRQLRRGGGSTPSQWELITEPSEEKFAALTEGTKTPTNSRSTRDEIVDAKINDLNKRVFVLEQALKGVIEGG